MRVPLTDEMSECLTGQIAAIPPAPRPNGTPPNTLPLYEGWLDTIGLRTDGELIMWSTEGEYSGTKPVEERGLWLNSLVHAAKRFPELNALVPARPRDARDCDHLAIPKMVELGLFCTKCGGLGWVDGPADPGDSLDRGGE